MAIYTIKQSSVYAYGVSFSETTGCSNMKLNAVGNCLGMSLIRSCWRHDDVIIKEKCLYFLFLDGEKRFLL